MKSSYIALLCAFLLVGGSALGASAEDGVQRSGNAYRVDAEQRFENVPLASFDRFGFRRTVAEHFRIDIELVRQHSRLTRNSVS